MTDPNNELRSLIDAEIASRSGAKEPLQTPPPRQSSAKHIDLPDAVQQAHTDADAPVAQPTHTSALTTRAVVAIAIVLAVLLAAWAWQARTPALSGHAATLHNLAQAVEQYRLSRNGSLPEQLSNLEQFPKGAVEWQLRHWKARDAAGRTEIIWAPNGSKHYRIVLRQGNEVWVYSDIDGQSRQTKP